MSDRDRCEFVRTNLALIVTAAKSRLEESDAGADDVILDVGQLPRPDGQSGERRQTARRKSDRRKTEASRAGLAERRRGDRRKGERRTPTAKPE
jgi:hypothetical protein